MGVSGRRRTAGPLLALLLIGAARATAQEERQQWSGSVAAFLTVVDDLAFVLPVAAVDRGPLHLEARYNYEDLGAFSGWVGWNVDLEGALAVRLTPMVGGIVGSFTALAPGFELTLEWRSLSFYSETELALPLDDGDPFLFTWSSVRWQPHKLVVLGASGQSLEAAGTERLIDLGPMIGLSIGPVGAEVYWFNPGTSDAFMFFGATFSF